MLTKENIAEKFKILQDKICQAIENIDEKGKFIEDVWQHHSGGGGRTRLIQKGNILEKGGVNFSAVQGETSEALMKQINLTEKADYFATGVSIVMHPNNPMVPIIHMNVRYFEMSNGIWWFGGGIDLTPHYVFEDDARWFHQQLKNVCDKANTEYYPKFKTWADDYFFIPHRNETRGIGGIFFDYLKNDPNQNGTSKEELFDFTYSVGNTFAPTYTYLMQKNKDLPFDETEKKWQMLRRGRYVEFNLVWDRGTKFGLETNGRIESILMSLPPIAHWEYDFKPVDGSKEAKTLSLLQKKVNWIE